jgi:putative Holliday junction resolvase
MRYLAIDLGEKRTGLAAGSDVTGIVSPVGVITATTDSERMRGIAEAIAEHGADELVLGLPLNMDGSEGDAAKRVRALKGFIEQRHGIPVRLMDERLSTFDADLQMAGRGFTRGRKKELRDALAAAVILRDYLALKAKK